MKPEGCDRFLDEIIQGGSLSPDTVAHLSTCPACAAEHETLQKLKKRGSPYELAALAPLRAKVLANAIPGAVGGGAAALTGGMLAKVLVPVVVAGVLSYFTLAGDEPNRAPVPAPSGVATATTVLPPVTLIATVTAALASSTPEDPSGITVGSPPANGGTKTGKPGPGGEVNYLPPSDD